MNSQNTRVNCILWPVLSLHGSHLHSNPLVNLHLYHFILLVFLKFDKKITLKHFDKMDIGLERSMIFWRYLWLKFFKIRGGKHLMWGLIIGWIRLKIFKILLSQFIGFLAVFFTDKIIWYFLRVSGFLGLFNVVLHLWCDFVANLVNLQRNFVFF